MALPIKEFRPGHNAEVMNAIRNIASSDYQRRVPSASKASAQETFRDMWNYGPARNEFIDALVNRIGMEILRTKSWSNPLAKFKHGMLEFGDTIEEIAVGLAEARTYEHDRDYLERDIFGQETPEVQTRFHKINREEFYKITIKEFAIQRAFLTDNGLTKFITELMEVPATSDQWDEFLHMSRLFKLYEESEGFFKVQIPNISASTSTADDARYTLRRFREMAGNLAFMSRRYNAARMPMAVQPEDLELFITPEANAAIDVEALAAAFNVDKAHFDTRTTLIPSQYLGIDGAQAILTTRDFFVIADTRLETTSAANPVGLYNNYFFHHHQVISASPFAPAILFTVNEGDVIEIEDTPVTGMSEITVVDRDENEVTELERGDIYKVTGSAITTPAGGLNDAVVLTLEGAENATTRIHQTGHLTVTNYETADSLTINATSVDDAEFTATVTVTLTGDVITTSPLGIAEDEDESDPVG